MTRGAFTIAMSAALLLAAVVAAAPARAADEVGLSADGVVWYDALHRPLFDPSVRWVPGDAETASFYVRNQGPSAAQLTIEVRSADGVRLLAGDVAIAARAEGRRWLAIDNGMASPWLTERAIARGGQVRVDVQVRFLWHAPNDTMLDRLPLDFQVRLIEAGPSDGGPGPDSGPDGLLPDTGSAVSLIVIWVAAILVGSGLALLAAARRRRSQEQDDQDGHDGDAAIVDEGVRVDG